MLSPRGSGRARRGGDSESSSFPHPRSPGGRRAVRLGSGVSAGRTAGSPPSSVPPSDGERAGAAACPSRRTRAPGAALRSPPLLPKGHSAVRPSQTVFGGRTHRPSRSAGSLFSPQAKPCPCGAPPARVLTPRPTPPCGPVLGNPSKARPATVGAHRCVPRSRGPCRPGGRTTGAGGRCPPPSPTSLG